MFLSALLIGFLGSVHCIAMCSPITLMLGGKQRTSQFVFRRVSYNVGRILGYAILGTFAGVFGRAINLAGLQQWFSIGLGVALLLLVLFFGSSKVYNPSFQSLQKLVIFLRTKFSGIYQSEIKFKGLLIGLLNGFLPCGLVYMAIIGAITMDSIPNSMLYMIVFGLGTWPMMFFVAFASGVITNKSNAKLLRIVPVLIAILFIVRGLGLGIPYLSPEMNPIQSQTTITDCVDVDY